MNANLNQQIGHLGFWSGVTFLVTVVVSLLLPLDVPDGLQAAHVDRVIWLNEHRSAFILGWVNQMVSMLSLSGVLLAVAWLVAMRSPLSGMVGGIAILLSITAFIIPKFIAIWTIPQLAEASATGGVGSVFADQLLLILNVSVPFSLYTSLDYLGFWLYALFSLVIAAPLFKYSLIWKVTAVSLGVFGAAFHAIFIALLIRKVVPTDIEFWFLGSALFLVVAIIAAVPGFRTTGNQPRLA